MSDASALRDAALSYAAAGLSVIPAYGKRPALTAWQRWQTNIPDEMTIRSWWNGSDGRSLTVDAREWARNQPFNVGIVTGRISGVFVLDIDTADGLEAAADFGLPDTLTVYTSVVAGFQRRQLYFAYPDDFTIRNDAKGTLPGCDVRGQGGYVVAPPSAHATGQAYAWDGDGGFSCERIAAAPEWLLERLRSKVERRQDVAELLSLPTVAPSDVPARAGVLDDAGRWVDRALERTSAGARNATGFWLACQLRDNGAIEADAERAMREYAARVPSGDHAYTEGEALASLKEAYASARRAPAQAQECIDIVTSTPDVAHVETAKLPGPEIVTAFDLLQTDFPPPTWVVEEILPTGLAMVAGKPKVGKSWMALDVAISVVTRKKALGAYATEEVDVLYLALEDTHRRLASRVATLASVDEGLRRLSFATTWPRLDQGGLEHLDAHLLEHPRTRFVILDTFARVKPPRGRGADLYLQDYAVAASLKELADARSLCLLLVHHLNKLPTADDVDAISGTTGITGAVDTVMTLRRERTEAEGTLFVTGRDVEEQRIALRWETDTASWTALGDADEVRTQGTRARIRAAIREGGNPMTPKEIADVTGLERNTVKQRAWQMSIDGELSADQGRYRIRTS